LTFAGSCPCYSDNSSRWGWVAGGGIEHMINKNWTARLEALYADFGSKTVAEGSGDPAFSGYTGTFKNTLLQVRAGLNWKW
jgi:opacity protein-like surface antigen